MPHRVHHVILSIIAMLSLCAGFMDAAACAQDAEPGQTTPDFSGGVRAVARLVPPGVRVDPDAPTTIVVLVEISPGWHIQAGPERAHDDFIPTELACTVPDGWTAGPTRWEEPEEITTGTGEYALTAASYAGDMLASITISHPPDIDIGTYPVSITVSYQACNDEGICEFPTQAVAEGSLHLGNDPGSPPAAISGNLEVRILALLVPEPVESASGGDASRSEEDRGSSRISNTLKWWASFALLVCAMLWMIGRTLQLKTGTPARVVVIILGLGISALAFSFVRGITSPYAWVTYTRAAFDEAMADGDRTVMIKFTADWCANCQVNERIILGSSDARLELDRDDVIPFKVDFTGPNPEGEQMKDALGGGGIPLIAVWQPGDETPLLLRGQMVSARPVIDALRGNYEAADGTGEAFDFLGIQFTVAPDAVLIILVLAFIAGVLMNFTPCVLPVIPLKILSMQTHARHPARCFTLGLFFSAGIITVYAVIGLFMAGLVVGIERIDWGDQFQNWWLNVLLGLIVGTLGIGMLGIFTIRLPKMLYLFNPQSDTNSGSFCMGLLTAVLSTPCTGPLLGATVAWTTSQSATIAFTTLLTMGCGMAAPYVLLTARPQWLERIPRTGPGSELIKQVMGLLLLAVAIWFVGNGVSGMS